MVILHRDIQDPGSFHLVALPSLDIALSHVSERHTWMPGKEKGEQDTAPLHSCPFRAQSWGYTRHFCSHPIDQNLLMYPFIAAGEAGSMIFILGNLAKEKAMAPTAVLLPGKSHGQRSLVGCSPWGHWESDTTERLHFHFSLSCIGEGNGNPLQWSCLENPRDGKAWWAAVYGVARSRTRLKRLSSSSSNLAKNSITIEEGVNKHTYF